MCAARCGRWAAGSSREAVGGRPPWRRCVCMHRACVCSALLNEPFGQRAAPVPATNAVAASRPPEGVADSGRHHRAPLGAGLAGTAGTRRHLVATTSVSAAGSPHGNAQARAAPWLRAHRRDGKVLTERVELTGRARLSAGSLTTVLVGRAGRDFRHGMRPDVRHGNSTSFGTYAPAGWRGILVVASRQSSLWMPANVPTEARCLCAGP